MEAEIYGEVVSPSLSVDDLESLLHYWPAHETHPGSWIEFELR
jgi:hypothetical protein